MFILPDLPYSYNALEPYIDEKTMRIHHDKHHAAYVKNLNDTLVGFQQFNTMPIEQLLKNLSSVPEQMRTKVRNFGGGHYNHSLFWHTMGPTFAKASTSAKATVDESAGKPAGKLQNAIDKVFGSVQTFQEQFSASALGLFGSGWTWLVVNKGTLEILNTANQDSPLSEGKTPLLCLDVWEHAYYLKYQNLRAEYIKNWWNVVNWSEVARRFEDAVQYSR